MSSIATIEDDLRQGRIAAVQTFLETLPVSAIPEAELWRYGNWARRAGRPALTLRWLKARVYPKDSLQKPPRPQEKAEYAMGLQRLGAYQEAERLLGEINPDETPTALLYRALCRFSQWDYEGGGALLQPLLDDHRPLDDYSRQVVRVNFAAALTAQADARADLLLETLREELSRDGLSLLLSNVLELRAQRRLQGGDYRGTLEVLAEARTLLNAAKVPDQLFIEKWATIARALLDADLSALDGFRTRALELGHWETLRDLDSYRLKLDPEPVKANWLYRGTPHVSYRRRLQAEFPNLIEAPEQPAWISRLPGPANRWDPLEIGEETSSLGHRMILLGLRDFYRPLRVGEIFSALFEGKIFDLDVATNRVQQAVRTTRLLIESKGWPLRLESRDGTYGLRWPGELAILCDAGPWPISRVGIQLAVYRRKNPAAEFGMRDVGTALGLSDSQTQRLLKEAAAEGILEKFGAGKSTAYGWLSRK